MKGNKYTVCCVPDCRTAGSLSYRIAGRLASLEERGVGHEQIGGLGRNGGFRMDM